MRADILTFNLITHCTFSHILQYRLSYLDLGYVPHHWKQVKNLQNFLSYDTSKPLMHVYCHTLTANPNDVK